MKKLLLTIAMIASLISCENNDEGKTVQNDANAQSINPSRICASDDILQSKIASDPEFAARRANIEAFTRNYVANESTYRLVNNNVVIPIMFNILYNTNEQNISEAKLHQQIEILNKDFAGVNPNPDLVYNDKKGKSKIVFEYAGSQRKYTTKLNWKFTEVVSLTGFAATTPTTKLNIWIVPYAQANDNSIRVGYASFPGFPANMDGVVISHDFVSFSPNPGYRESRGKTAAHEVGHYLGLNHIWGDTTCGNDGITDTPQHDKANEAFVPVGARSGCPSNEFKMYMNFMDYTSENLQTMFTTGQVSVMNATLAAGGPRQSFRAVDNNVATVYQHGNYGGYAVKLPVGNYTLQQLQQKGVVNDDLSSATILYGYEIILFQNDNFLGNSLIVGTNSSLFTNGFNDITSSIRVRVKP